MTKVLKVLTVAGVLVGATAAVLNGAENIACNCVLYARSRVPSLPGGLYTIADKKRIINSTVPTVGSVAIHDIYAPYGHVSVVEKVNTFRGKITTIQIREANYSTCKITTRTKYPRDMNVIGYYKP